MLRYREQSEPCHCGAQPGERCIAYRSGKRMAYLHMTTSKEA